MDISVSAGALLALSPLFILTALLLMVVNRGSGAFFLQERPGKGGVVFRMVKFKTMTDERDPEGKLLPDEKRLTKVGMFLRSTSLDELPQLWNVIKGEMSLIGPRPLLTEYLPLYSERQARRHEIRPGISGMAQCRGRNSLSWERRFELDVWYVDNVSFKTDCAIILATLRKVILRDGISAEGSATMEAFTGSN